MKNVATEKNAKPSNLNPTTTTRIPSTRKDARKLFVRWYTAAEAIQPTTLVVVLHGDAPRNDPDYQPTTDFSFAIDEAAGVTR